MLEAFFDIIDMFATFSRKRTVSFQCIIIYQHFPWSPFHLINTSATWLRISFLANRLPCRKFHKEHFLSQKFFSRSNRTWDIGEKQNLGDQNLPQFIERPSWRVGTFQGNFPRLPRHIFTKSCFPQKIFFQMSLATRLLRNIFTSLHPYSKFSGWEKRVVTQGYSWEGKRIRITFINENEKF